MKKIGIEKGLSNIAGYLIKEGYSVESLNQSVENNIPILKNLDAIVTSGLNTDMLGISDTATRAPVINAKGLSPEEVKSRIEEHFS